MTTWTDDSDNYIQLAHTKPSHSLIQQIKLNWFIKKIFNAIKWVREFSEAHSKIIKQKD